MMSPVGFGCFAKKGVLVFPVGPVVLVPVVPVTVVSSFGSFLVKNTPNVKGERTRIQQKRRLRQKTAAEPADLLEKKGPMAKIR